jgi:hemoglobin
LSADATNTQTTTTLYETLGGIEPLKIAVDRFYERILSDPQLQHYFDGVDLARVKRHQVLLFSQLLGGPAQYDGRALGEAHAGLDITGPDYDRVVEHLIGTLQDLGVDGSVVSAVEGAVADVRPEIVPAHPER